MPSPEMIGHFAKLAEIMKHSTEYMENIGKFLQNPENVAKFYIKDNGDGSYTSGAEMGAFSHHTVFKLDGAENQVQGYTDNKVMIERNTFEGGVWTCKAHVADSGCPELVCTFRRVGDEIVQTTSLADVYFETVYVKE